MEKIDVAIIGAGIVGLNLAKLLLEKRPNLTVCVFEKENFLGEHTSGRNSGVVHSGIYYPTGSLKHLLCKEGNYLWSKLAHDLNIPLKYCGKFIIANGIAEINILENLKKQADSNGVSAFYITQLDNKKELFKHFQCTDALFIPSTGIIDQSTALIKLRDEVEKKGGIVLMNHALNNVNQKNGKYFLSFGNDLEVIADKLINCAGLGAVEIRKKLLLYDVQDYWVKGTYLKSTRKNLFKSLVYPVPLPGLKGLGVHLTFDFNDTIKFGPNTEDVTVIDYKISNQTIEEMTSCIDKFVMGFSGNLSPDYAGIRPKIKYENKLYSDFWIKEPIQNYIEMLGIESPGFTASPAIAKYVFSQFF